jgi:hypothetical protein
MHMKNLFRLVLVALASITALVLSGSALAAFTSPKLIITSPAGGGLTIRAEQVKEDDAPFRLTIYVPLGYTTNLTAADGSQIGTATAQVQANAISPDAILELTGVIRIDTTFTAAEYPGAAPCLTGTGVTAPVVFRLELTAAGQNLLVPAYMTPITAGPEAAFASAKLITCLPSPYIPTSAGGAAFGAKLINANLTFPTTFTSPAAGGELRWRSIWTPYTVGGAVPNAAATVESDGLAPSQARLTLRAGTYTKKTKRLAVSGSLTQGGRGIAGAVNITVNGRRLAGVRAGANGAFRASLRITKKGTYSLRASASAQASETTGCTAVVPGINCLRTTTAGFSATSATVRVRIR